MSGLLDQEPVCDQSLDDGGGFGVFAAQVPDDGVQVLARRRARGPMEHRGKTSLEDLDPHFACRRLALDEDGIVGWTGRLACAAAA